MAMQGQHDRRVAVVIEDDQDIRNLLETVLSQAGFSVITAANGLDGIDAVRVHDPTVVTLDVNLPGIDGFETAKRIRSFSDTYIVMLTALQDEIDTLQGLEAGADDYVTKPFRPRELRARIEAMLRRPRGVAGASTSVPEAAGGERLEHDGLVIDLAARVVEVDGAEVALTRSEFDLLASLMQSKRRVRTKEDLALLLRGEIPGAYVSDADKRGIEVHMGNLRKKLGESSTSPRWIETVRGVGYRLTAGADG